MKTRPLPRAPYSMKRARFVFRVSSFVLTLCLCVVATLLLWADTTGDLRATADGGQNLWDDAALTNCGSTDCFDDVDESSGTSCSTTPSNGDTDYIVTAANAEDQSFDLDESSIPDGVTVTDGTIYICARKVPAQGTNITGTICINGTCTDGTDTTLTTSYADYSFSINFTDDIKGAGDDYECGVDSGSAREMRVSAIKCIFTYTPPGQPPLRRRILLSRYQPRPSLPASSPAAVP